MNMLASLSVENRATSVISQILALNSEARKVEQRLEEEENARFPSLLPSPLTSS